MASVTRASDVDIDMSNALYASQIPDLTAGEDLAAGKLCYVKASDGKAYLCMKDDGAGTPAADERGRVIGVTARTVKSGQPVTLFGPGVRIRLASDGTLTPNDPLYVGDNGDLDTAPTTNDPNGVAIAINSTDVLFVRQVVTTG